MPTTARAARGRKRGPRRSSKREYRRELVRTLRAFRRGHFAVVPPKPERPDDRELSAEIGAIFELNRRLAHQLQQISESVGKEGKIRRRADLGRVGGSWAACVDCLNTLIADLVRPTTEVSRVIGAVAKGDLSQKIGLEIDGRPMKGEFLRTARTVNTMVDQLGSFASEVTRVAREVGTEGKLGGQAQVKGVSGTWKDLTDNVNTMASNLTSQVRSIAQVTTAVAKGDLSKKITVDVEGEILELKNTINAMVDQLSSFASEVTRVAREVGTDGKLGGQAQVKGVSGTWKDLTDNVNTMASNLTNQVRNIAQVTTAVANGDLSKKFTVDVKGEILELKNTINAMVVQLSTFASEVTRVAREVGTDGKLGGQAAIRDVSGVWKDLTENVNTMASNLTNQVRNIAKVTTAVAKGDLSKKITVDVKGEILELKNTINAMVDQLSTFASEVTRVAREVGTDGKLGGQAAIRDVSGVWKDLTDNVNTMASNLTNQVRNIAKVTTAVAKGDLSKKITVDVRGEILELKNTINAMVDQLSSFASEVTRVAREVGTEGKLGGQAQVKGVSGTWKDLTDNANTMASNLTNQVRNIAQVTTAVAKGDLSKKITVDVKGEILELKNTINAMVDQLSSFASEVTRVAREVGTEGKLGGQAQVKGVSGTWKDLTDNVNTMAGNLTNQVRDIAEVTDAVAKGDLSKKVTVDVRGEILRLKNTINAMVDQLSSFASEVTRVAREVGTDGKLGGQAQVKGVSGTWKDLTDNVNTMASNLTSQVRGIAQVVTAVANGNLRRKLVLEARGEIAALAQTINEMIDTLAIFADQVTTVAREVGTEGRLGGQAKVPGAAGIWKDLTENVNQLAANLTTQVRAIGEVATAVTKGDLTRSITVETQGEVLALKDNINEMIRNLRETTRKNVEQDWLKTNLAKFASMMQGQKDLNTVCQTILSELATVVFAQCGVFYVNIGEESEPRLRLLASYAHKGRAISPAEEFASGEGLIGQCALEKKRILMTGISPDYVRIRSGLGASAPLSIVTMPVLFEGKVKAVVELASFNSFTEVQLAFLDQLTESIGVVLNTIAATMRTEDLLAQSQSLTEQLQRKQQELQEKNKDLEEKAVLLSAQKKEVESKNSEVEQARQTLQDRAEQLALTSRYKSQFLANMSHELRTPLNSLLLLARQLADNLEKNLSPKQIEYAQIICAAGNDLLALINDILDLSKIEAGAMTIEIQPIALSSLKNDLERNFGQLAQSKNLAFKIELADGLPKTLSTDSKRLQQVLRNLLSNAFKFTEKGSVTVRIEPAEKDASPESVRGAGPLISFSVSDTGIGIAEEKQAIIFEAFQQVDGGTDRKYGGTGLGLTISREIARLLGGEIRVRSSSGGGSTFTFYLPWSGAALKAQARRRAPDAPPTTEPVETVEDSPPVTPLPVAAVDDDRDAINPGDLVLLIVEDNPIFARLMLDSAREQGFKGVVALQGDAGLATARLFSPQAAVVDLRLPDMTGWMVLDALKHDPALRHIPVLIMSGAPDEERRALKMGAVGYLEKPATRETLSASLSKLVAFVRNPERSLLLVENDEACGRSILELIGDDGVRMATAKDGAEALRRLNAETYQCAIIDAAVPDAAGLLSRLAREPRLSQLPLLIYSGRKLPREEEMRLRHASRQSVAKLVQSPEHLVDETDLFLHRIAPPLALPRDEAAKPRQSDPVLAGRQVLVVDDDIRNLFSITSVLERYQMRVLNADNGRKGIETLERVSDIDIVLMDVMMPEMNGYEAMQEIRKNKKFRGLPIIAVTAKAMKGDREKCIQAGASDYIPKPVDVDQLLAVLRVWLS
ncbi:MAG: HAMP domain-containing protein [Elusimicrobiota bacterium]